MTLDLNNVTRGVTGMVSVGPAGTALPTAVNSALNAALKDLGWINEDGVTRSLPGAGDRQVTRGWQNNGVVLIIRTPNDDNPTFSFICLETKKEVIEFVLGVTITASATDGKWIIDSDAARVNKVMVLDVVDGARLRRQAIPKAIVTEIGDQVYQFGEPVGWEVTVECERDTTVGGHIIEWDSAFATP